jgi:ankyrin repeat protein
MSAAPAASSSPTSPPPSSKPVSLYEACRKGDLARVQGYTGTVLESDTNKMTMLHHACHGGQAAIVQLLIDRNAELDAADSDGWTPLHFAAQGGYHDLVALLAGQGANINAKDQFKRTPLHIVACGKTAAHLETAKQLVKHGAAMAVKNAANLTAAETATANGASEELVAVLSGRPVVTTAQPAAPHPEPAA